MFKKGNIIRIKCGRLGDQNDDIVGRIGVIEYGKKYHDILDKETGKPLSLWGVLDKETGESLSVWEEDKLEFISEGGDNEITKCYEAYAKLEEKESDLNFIKEKILAFDFCLSATSMLKLFEEIGYTSSYFNNGENICLVRDWYRLGPIFINAFHERYDEMIEALKVFKEEYRAEYEKNAIAFYNKINFKGE